MNYGKKKHGGIVCYPPGVSCFLIEGNALVEFVLRNQKGLSKPGTPSECGMISEK
jgi:hypothetical protein